MVAKIYIYKGMKINQENLPKSNGRRKKKTENMEKRPEVQRINPGGPISD